MRFILSFILLLAGSEFAHAVQIGVAAGIRGQVIKASSPQRAAIIGQMSSGHTVYLGDEIKVGEQSRLQVMLLDETIFTLGANAAMTIDEFLYDPSLASANTLTASVKQGAFRFVSGQVAIASPDAMKVKTPAATIGVRGTSVAGEVEEDGSTTVILLGPGLNNSLGLAPGSISVTNDIGSIEITRPGFVTQIRPRSEQTRPTKPVQASHEQIQELEQSLSEQAITEIAKELDVDVKELRLQTGEDTDNDGELDTFASNEVLSDTLGAAIADGETTQDRTLIAATALSLLGQDLLELEGEELQDFFDGVNLGTDVADIFNQGSEYLGQTSLADIRAASLTGSATFFANNVVINGHCETGECGSYNVRNVWDFTNQTVTSSLTGNFSIEDGRGLSEPIGSGNDVGVATFIEASMNMQAEQLDWREATGGAAFEFGQIIPADNLVQLGQPESAFGRVGDAVFDSQTNAVSNSVPVDQFVTLTQGTIPDNATLEVFSTSSLANVQFGGAGSNVANFSDHTVSVTLRPSEIPVGAGPLIEQREIEGLVFGLETE